MKKLKINYKNIQIELIDSTSSIMSEKKWSSYWNKLISVLSYSLHSYLKKNKLISSKQQCHISVYYCGISKITKLNQFYRAKNKKTDVLSFPIHQSVINDQDNIELMPELELGDIFICHQVLERQAKEYSLSSEEEFYHLFIHGFLHLIGYDHEISEVEEKKMQKQETELIRKVSFFLKKRRH